MKPNIVKPLVLFIIFLVILSMGIIYFLQISVPSLPKIPFSKSKQTTTTTTKAVEVVNKNGKIVLSYKQIEGIMSECCSTYVSQVRADDKDGKLYLTGKALKPLSSDFEAYIGLSVADEKIRCSIDYLKVGKIESPSFLRDPLSKAIQKYFDDKINSQYKLKSVRIDSVGIILELI